jgi:uncharacterized membrane protein YphA (DoxX/SURF4 family)
MKKQIIIEIICFLFILLFVYAAAAKLLDYEKFSIQIGQSPLLTPYAKYIAALVPIVEVVIAIMLAMSRFRTIGLYAAFTLMVIFTAYIVAILNFNGHIPCSCGGVLEKLGWKEHLVFNIVFVLFSVAGILLYSKQDRIVDQVTT